MEAHQRQAIELYRSGVKTSEITERTGISRPRLYALLRSEGIEPNRDRSRMEVELAPDQFDHGQLRHLVMTQAETIRNLVKLLVERSAVVILVTVALGTMYHHHQDDRDPFV